MTWAPETSRGYESAKIAAVAVPYLQGRALDLGCGNAKVWPGLIGVDNNRTFGPNEAVDVVSDLADLSMFADGSMDAVFSSHALEDFPRADVPAVLREWARVLKIGGHLVLYVPSANLYPKCGEPGANPAHKWDIYPGDIEGMLRDIAGWELLESEERSQKDEYSLFVVVRKTEGGWKENVWQRHPGDRKRALVCRFGAVGDQIVAASVLPGLREQGYHVTYMSTPEGASILRHDPHVDGWIIQAKDFVPNVQLGPYWEQLNERYDRMVNLCESVEGSLLTLPGRLSFNYPHDVRDRLYGNVNYLERTAEIAGVPCNPDAARFYASEAELAAARTMRAAMDGPVVFWAINGSSPHKVYGYVDTVCKWLLAAPLPVHIVLSADPGIGKELQDAIVKTLAEDGVPLDRLHPMAGKWGIRDALAFCQVCDVVVGPETGPLNAAAMNPDVAKVIYLSHSSHANLTEHWLNTTVLKPAGVACYPCHRLHFSWEHCHQDETSKTALCAAAIEPAQLLRAIAMGLGAAERKAA